MAVISGVKVTDGGQGLAGGVQGSELVQKWSVCGSIWEAGLRRKVGRGGEAAAHRRRKGRQGVAGWGFSCPVQLRRMRV